MTDRLKPGDVTWTRHGEWLEAVSPETRDRDVVKAYAAQLNAALAVVERVRAARERAFEVECKLGVGCGESVRVPTLLVDVLGAILEPDDGTRATLPGAEWLGGTRG